MLSRIILFLGYFKSHHARQSAAQSIQARATKSAFVVATLNVIVTSRHVVMSSCR